MTEVNNKQEMNIVKENTAKEEYRWHFNFVREKMTEEEYEEYLKYGIKGMYSGNILHPSSYCYRDREHGMLLVGNEAPIRIDNMQDGPSYYNFIYKGKVGIIGSDTYYEFNKPCPFYFKRIILDKSWKDEEEYICEAIKCAVLSSRTIPVEKYIAEWPDKIEYKGKEGIIEDYALIATFTDFVNSFEGDVSTPMGMEEFVKALNALFDSYEVELEGGKELLSYCGKLNISGRYTQSYMIIDALCKGKSTYGYLGSTNLGRVLNSSYFKKALKDKFDESVVTNILQGQNGTRYAVEGGSTLCVTDFLANKVVMACCEGDVRPMVFEADPNAVFFRTEFDALLANNKVKKIWGMEKSVIKSMYENPWRYGFANSKVAKLIVGEYCKTHSYDFIKKTEIGIGYDAEGKTVIVDATNSGGGYWFAPGMTKYVIKSILSLKKSKESGVKTEESHWKKLLNHIRTELTVLLKSIKNMCKKISIKRFWEIKTDRKRKRDKNVTEVNSKKKVNITKSNITREECKWHFNFVREKMTDEEYREYMEYGIKGMYSGRLVDSSGYWYRDRKHEMILVGNEVPIIGDSIQDGPMYDNFIYKGKVGIIGIEIHYKSNQSCPFHFKRIILDKSWKDEEECICEAIKCAVFSCRTLPVKKYIAEWPDTIEYR